MHQITIYGDIHANLPALEAVYSDMHRRNLENRLCLGDLVGYGTFPDEVMELVRQSGDPNDKMDPRKEGCPPLALVNCPRLSGQSLAPRRSQGIATPLASMA